MGKIKKPFKSYDEQIDILKNRGLIINDEEFCKMILKRENYYNIINGYRDIFLDKTSNIGEKYLDNVTFENVYSVYKFDLELKNILLKYILKFETLLKTKVSYHHSKKFNTKFNFFDVNNFQGDSSKITKLISIISNEINKNNIKNNSFYHYINNHGELPLWVLFQKANFGTVSYFYEVLKDDIKKEICDELNLEFNNLYNVEKNHINIFLLENIAHFLNVFRNICAHNERLYSSKNKVKGFNLDYSAYTNQQFRGNIFDLIVILKLFLEKEDFVVLSDELDNALKKLKIKLENQIKIYSLILNSNLFFPINWKEILNKFWL